MIGFEVKEWFVSVYKKIKFYLRGALEVCRQAVVAILYIGFSTCNDKILHYAALTT